MSLVGTRPILQDELLKYELHHRARIAIKPGITGMWQVSGRSDITDFEEVVRLDTELKNHMEYINRNYSSFRTQIHEDKDKAINEEYSGNYLVGPRKNLLVDPQKDIDVKYIAIGGVEREDKSIEESHEIVKCKPADNLEIASWNSFVRKLDEYHGHHPVQ